MPAGLAHQRGGRDSRLEHAVPAAVGSEVAGADQRGQPRPGKAGHVGQRRGADARYWISEREVVPAERDGPAHQRDELFAQCLGRQRPAAHGRSPVGQFAWGSHRPSIGRQKSPGSGIGRRVLWPQSGLLPIPGGDMITVHIENTVQDFDTWKANFDKYERFRAEQGVQSYRVSRSVTEPNEVLIDLEFCDQTAAQAFLPQLEKIMNSPQAQAQLVRHSVPLLYAVVTDRVPSATG